MVVNVLFFFCVLLYSCVLSIQLSFEEQFAALFTKWQKDGIDLKDLDKAAQPLSLGIKCRFHVSFSRSRWCVATRLGEKSPAYSPRPTDTDRTADAVEKAASRSWRPATGETAWLLLEPKHFYVPFDFADTDSGSCQVQGWPFELNPGVSGLKVTLIWEPPVRQVDFALEFSSTFAAFAESRAGCKINPTVPRFWQEKWCFGN